MAKPVVGRGPGRPRKASGPARCVLLLVACALLGPSQVHAQMAGLNLSWDDCGVSGTLNKNFACDTNADVSVLVASVGILNVSPTVVRSNIVFMFSGLVPSWWALQGPVPDGDLPGCRYGAVSVSASAGGRTGCMDYFGTHQGMSVFDWDLFTSGGQPIGYNLDILTYTLTPNAERLGDAEIYAGIITFDHRQTGGPDSCGGCSIPGGFTYLNATISSIELSDRTTTTPRDRDYVFWQQPTVSTRRTTWGGVKALYK